MGLHPPRAPLGHNRTDQCTLDLKRPQFKAGIVHLESYIMHKMHERAWLLTFPSNIDVLHRSPNLMQYCLCIQGYLLDQIITYPWLNLVTFGLGVIMLKSLELSLPISLYLNTVYMLFYTRSTGWKI